MHAPEGGTTTLHPSFSFQRTFFPMHLPSLLTGQRYNALGRSASSVIHPAFLPVQSTGVACTRPGLGVGGPHVSGFSCQPTKTASGPSDSTLPTFSTCAAAMSPRSQREHATPHTSFTIDAILGAAEEKTAHEASDLRTRGLLGTRHQPYPLQQRPYTQRKDAIAPFHGCLSRSLNSYPRDYRLPEQKASQNDRKSSPSGDLSPLPWKQNKSKRVRTIFTPEQLERLEAEFERQQYMVGTERYYLAASLNLTEGQVKVWFQNRRIKWRKHSLEMQHAKMAGRSDIFLPAEETSETDEERELIASRDHLRETPEADDRRDGGVDEYGDLVIDNCTESLGVNGDLFQCEGLDASSLVSNENDEV